MVSVFQFLDYREFLRSYFEERKSESSWFSYKIMGDAIGLDQSQIYRILQGTLHISKAALPRFVDFLGFKGPAEEYFIKLVAFGRARKESDSRALFAELILLRGSKSNTLEAEQLLLYSEWHHTVIRALLSVVQISDNYELVGKWLSPNISTAQVKKSFQLLQRLKLIQKDNHGIWRLTEKNITTGSNYHSLMVKQYQAYSLQLAMDSLSNHSKEQRDINVINMSVDESAFKDCLAILKEARSQIRNRIEKVKHPDRILRLTQALFPVAIVDQPLQESL